VSLQAAEPVVDRLNGLLLYPAPYAEEEVSPNVFYTGAAPNQQAAAAIDYLRSARGGGVRRWVLEGTDYIYPHQMNDGIRAYLLAKKVSPDDIVENETPFDFSDWKGEVARIKAFGGTPKKTAVISTLMGGANDTFYAELDAQGVHSRHVPVLSLTLDEQALTQLSAANIAGGLAARSYFEGVKSAQNSDFKAQWRGFVHDPERVTDDALEATYIGFKLWAQAVVEAGSTDVDAVRTAMAGQSLMSPSGYAVTMLPDHHLAKPAMIGVVRKNGQFTILYQSPAILPPRLWSAVLAQPEPGPAKSVIEKPAIPKKPASLTSAKRKPQ
jgi:ABC-type branched-subunit amino acid transport system substrate-binding protein